MDRLPQEILQEIQSYLHIVSWRAELHYFTLLEWLSSRTIHNMPLHIKEQLIERKEAFIYNNGHYLSYISKGNWYAVQCARVDIIRRYTDPLRKYLTKYRLHHIMNTWDLKTSFRLFGLDVHGILDANQYELFLVVQGYREGNLHGQPWSGCLPFETYKEACTTHRMGSLEN
jgi:hypothetical protein